MVSNKVESVKTPKVSTPVYNAKQVQNINKLPQKNKQKHEIKNSRGSPRVKSKIEENKHKTKPTKNITTSTISKTNLENELLSYDYLPIEKIIIRDKTNGEKAKYLKALNKLGQTVFIDLDADTSVQLNHNDQIFVESTKNTLSYSSKLGSMKSLDLDVCGVAFQCHNGICTLCRDHRSSIPIESSFTSVDNKLPKIGIINDNPIPYPIVRLSEIRENPFLVLKTINRATKKLRNISYDECILSIKETTHIIGDLSSTYKKFTHLQEVKFKSISESIEILEKKLIDIKHDDLNGEDKRLYKLLKYNIHLRNDRILDLLSICQDVYRIMNTDKSSIIGIIQYLTEIVDYLEHDPDFFSLDMTYLFEP